jgi:uridylate kinase
MYVHLKQSGELLSAQGDFGALWTPNGIRASTDKIASVHKIRSQLGVSGILMVSGAGNIVRGEKLRDQGIANGRADALGRLATVMNTIVLQQALEERKVPTATFIADTMSLGDSSIPINDFLPYDPEAVKEAYEHERVVLVAGGTGEDNKTTDNAVLEYARRHRESIDAEHEVLVLKGTKYDGVFDRDPAKDARANRYSRIPAGHMLHNYGQFSVVDMASLETINNSGIALRVYADGQHDLRTVLEDSDGVGTLIVPGYGVPVFANCD